MTNSERETVIQRLLSASMVTKPFDPPEKHKTCEELTRVTEKNIETGVGPTTVHLVETLERPSDSRVVVNYHGGGFIGPHTDRDIWFCRRLAVELGVLVVDVAYYTSKEAAFPAACYQCYDCVKWIVDHEKDLDCDSGRIILCGHSAGGNLATAVSYIAGVRQEFQIALQILDYPPTDFFTDPADKTDAKDTAVLPDWARDIQLLYLGAQNKGRDVLASPILASDEELGRFPETVLITAGKDNLRFEGEVLGRRLIESGVTVHSRRFLQSRHGFVISCMDEYEDALHFIYHMIRTSVAE